MLGWLLLVCRGIMMYSVIFGGLEVGLCFPGFGHSISRATT